MKKMLFLGLVTLINIVGLYATEDAKASTLEVIPEQETQEAVLGSSTGKKLRRCPSSGSHIQQRPVDLTTIDGKKYWVSSPTWRIRVGEFGNSEKKEEDG